MKNTKEIRTLRALIGSKPDYFQGGKRQWNELITSLLAQPDPTRSWVRKERKSKKGNTIVEWERE